MWFLRTMLLSSWTAKKSNERVSREADTTRLLLNRPLNRIPMCQATFFGHVIKGEKLKHLMTIRMIKGKQRERMK